MKKVTIPEFLKRLAKFKKLDWKGAGCNGKMLRAYNGQFCPIDVVFHPLRWNDPKDLPLTPANRGRILNAADGHKLVPIVPYSERLRRQLFKAVGLPFVPGQDLTDAPSNT